MKKFMDGGYDEVLENAENWGPLGTPISPDKMFLYITTRV